jgi:hypothetical protein
VVVGWSGLSIDGEVKRALMGTSGSRMSPETHIRANASKLGSRGCVSTREGEEENGKHLKKTKRAKMM